MHLLTILPLVCVFFCTANGLLTTHTASQNGPQPTSRQSSSSQFFSSNGTSPSSQRLPSSQQRSTGSVAVETDEPFLSTGKDTPKHEIQQNSSGPLNTTKLAFKGNPSSSSNTTLQEDTAAQKFTYNVWTVDSTDSDGNEAIWNYLRSSLGVDGFDIKVIGPSLDLSDVDAFRLELSMDQYKKLNAGVSTCGLISRQVDHSLYMKSKQLRNLDFVAQSCVTGCGPISNFIEEPPVEASGFSKRDETQFYRPWDLAYLSQPKVFAEGVGASLQDINGRYAYDETSAKNVTIYLLDTVRLSFHDAKSIADECFRAPIRTTWYGSCSPYDEDDGV